MAVWALGLNHNTAPLDLRGRFAFALDQIAPALTGLRRSFSAEGGADEPSLPVRSMPEGHPQVEAAILSTCNRTEIYCAGATEGNSKALAHTLGWLAQTGGVSPTLLQAHTYALHDEAVARHAFRVASGLDSMVLGEPQILGQMKDAVRAAEGAGALGSTLNQLFQRSFSVAKEVRTATDVGAHSISMAAAAVRLAAQLFEDLGEVRILFVGAGEMIELAATHFAARNPRAIVIANRTVERGQALASRFGAQTMHLAELPGRLQEFDVVISCTASTLPIIGLGAVERAVKARKHRPMFMVDLAVPRDIEPEVKALEDVYLYTVDDLAGVVQNGQAQRAAAAAQAEVIIDAGVENFMRWLDQRDPVHGTVGLIQKLNARADEWRAAEIARARRLLARGDDIDSVLESLSRGLTQKMLHGAMAELQGGDTEQRHQAAASVSRIFLRGNR